MQAFKDSIGIAVKIGGYYQKIRLRKKAKRIIYAAAKEYAIPEFPVCQPFNPVIRCIRRADYIERDIRYPSMAQDIHGEKKMPNALPVSQFADEKEFFE